jgi:hydrogenase maturation protease
MTRPLILALGNDLLGDDAAGLLAGREVHRLLGNRADSVETAAGGFALLDHLEHRTHVLILDTIVTGAHPPGTLVEMTPGDLDPTQACSPHTVGLPETIALARRLEIPFPSTIALLAMEISPATTIGAPLSPAIAGALPSMVSRAGAIVDSWSAGGS